MDLALELGMTVAGLKAAMTTTELGMWCAYARRKALPMRRIEFYLAQIAQVHAGGRLSDFLLFDRAAAAPASAPSVGTTASALALLSGGKVHRLKKKER